ncbi:hypothetical protein Purlil1_777 [Purpureocillium lilacinum]|uniref:C4-dicarboxylate transporter/malic acid transport protein n=1 Tax=Purpureocillium lilacinum TaxID=33203 RepID=A0ABR0CF96_PURLI|nr:hypothetical protein Purlil1_777 [Purpureocillium lilacinum]
MPWEASCRLCDRRQDVACPGPAWAKRGRGGEDLERPPIKSEQVPDDNEGAAFAALRPGGRNWRRCSTLLSGMEEELPTGPLCRKLSLNVSWLGPLSATTRRWHDDERHVQGPAVLVLLVLLSWWKSTRSPAGRKLGGTGPGGTGGPGTTVTRRGLAGVGGVWGGDVNWWVRARAWACRERGSDRFVSPAERKTADAPCVRARNPTPPLVAGETPRSESQRSVLGTVPPLALTSIAFGAKSPLGLAQHVFSWQMICRVSRVRWGLGSRERKAPPRVCWLSECLGGCAHAAWDLSVEGRRPVEARLPAPATPLKIGSTTTCSALEVSTSRRRALGHGNGEPDFTIVHHHSHLPTKIHVCTARGTRSSVAAVGTTTKDLLPTPTGPRRAWLQPALSRAGVRANISTGGNSSSSLLARPTDIVVRLPADSQTQTQTQRRGQRRPPCILRIAKPRDTTDRGSGERPSGSLARGCRKPLLSSFALSGFSMFVHFASPTSLLRAARLVSSRPPSPPTSVGTSASAGDETGKPTYLRHRTLALAIDTVEANPLGIAFPSNFARVFTHRLFAPLINAPLPVLAARQDPSSPTQATHTDTRPRPSSLQPTSFSPARGADLQPAPIRRRYSYTSPPRNSSHHASRKRRVARPQPRRLPHPPRLHQPRLLPCRAQPARRPLLRLQARRPPPRGPGPGRRGVVMAAADRAQVVMPTDSPHRSERAVSSQGCGYESPTEENQPPFFSSPSPTPSFHQPHGSAAVAPRPAAHGPVPRAPLTSRPSYVAAPASDGHAHAARGHGRWPPNQSSLNGMVEKAETMLPDAKVTLKDRIACYQWTYFTMTMATGGIANVIHSLPYRASWVTGIGVFFFLLNVSLFLLHCILIAARFYLRPGSFVRSFTDQVESLFIPAFFVSIAIIMINTCEYGVPRSGVWLLRTMEVMFWFYVALSVFASAGIYLVLWSTLIFPVHTMTPTWVFPAYPLLLTAPFAATLIDAAETSSHTLSLNATAVALGAATTQGTGCLIAFMISSAFVYRLMTQKLPRDTQRPGVFMSIGPFGFTAAGIAQLGNQASQIFPHSFLGSETTVDIVRVVSILVGLWLWGLAMWFFLVSVGSLWKYARSGSSLPFQMTWWSFVFPNTALVTATQVMGKIFQSKGLRLFGSIMTIVLVIVWVGVFVTMLHCLRTRKLLWPKSNT